MKEGVVLRAGELFLKGRNRPIFEKVLEDHVERVLDRFGALSLQRGQGRLFVEGGRPPGLLSELSWTPGVASLSPVVYVPRDMEVITKVVIELAREAQGQGVASFRITTRRPDKRFHLKSLQINIELGARVVEATGLEVNLSEPELEIGVEIGPKRSFVFKESMPGAGGLPIGVSGRAMLLLSGGIDSPVAGHLAQKRGLMLAAVHFHAAPWTSAASQEKVRELAIHLARRQGSLELHQIPFGQVQEKIRDATNEAYRIILYRRFMVRIARRIASESKCKALLTGDSLGQVASQTLENLACIEDATDMLLLRPLLGFDKAEVIKLAKKIGTYETSILPHDDCCSLFTPRHPQTKGSIKRARQLERRLEVDTMVEEALAEDSVEMIEG